MTGLIRALLAVALFSGITSAQAQAPIRIIHGSNAGAPQDVMLRILADELQKVLSEPVIVEPRPGAEGQIAMNALKQAPADGRTILSDGTGITSILQIPGARHKWTDFEPLYRLQLDPFALYALRGKYEDLSGFLSDMRVPGKVRVGGYSSNGPFRITLMLIARQAKGEFIWIPYDSGTRAITAVMSDIIEAAMSNISVYLSFKERTEVLAHTGETRLEQFPDIPTFKEKGVDIVRYHWRGMFVKRGTPEPVINSLFDSIGRAVKSKRFQDYLHDNATLDGTMSRAAYAQMLEEQAKSDQQILHEMGTIE